ncbi:prostate stem cell antigen-like [Paralichthys olivaceus]|uniref:prostate stem cell antigen-like n=1 Tax=Paralichthys olivaceus TaxID=8255 RepID=UPI00097D95C0|nr:PREDICTED: prostate stem cell antigen-like [Paralichthys olivaceus]
MKMLLSFVLLSLLFPPALALECYVCAASTTNEQCNQNTQECQTPLDTCMTSIDTLGTSIAIVKQCASAATCTGAASSSSVDENGNGNSVNCCNSFNLCNFSGAESVHVHTTLLLLTVVVIRLLSL